MESRLRFKLILYLRIVLTIGAWVLFISYAHHLSHLHLPGIKALLGSLTTQMIAQIVILSALAYFIMLSLPFFPNLNVRGFSILALWSTILVVGHQLSHEGFHQLRDNLFATSAGIGIYGLVLVAFIYALALSLPFIPGVEIGLLLMVLFGREGVIAAYTATILALSLGYLAAQAVPTRVSSKWMKTLRLSNAMASPRDPMDALIVDRCAPQDIAARLGRFLLSHRYLALAVSLNLPGNSAFGGGGGIAALCGLSGQFRWWPYFFTLTLATAPLPLLVLIGQVEIESLLERHGVLHDLLSRVTSIFVHQ